MTQDTKNFRPVKHQAWALWKNPIFLRYCRSRLRVRGLGVVLLIAVIISSFIVAMAYSAGVKMNLQPSDAARSAIIPLMVLQSIILFVLGTSQVSGGMTAERDEGVIDYQRLIPMTPLSKVVGFLFGLPVREYVAFIVTLPFTAWALWVGGVSWDVWLPLYGVIFSSTLLYHFTGLLTGTVAKNRRWAFLASIGLVFCLYTVIPQMAKFGLVFFKYLTIQPVFEECLPGILPESTGEVVALGQSLVPTVKFFGLDFSETVFTLFSQGGLILTFVVMLCRKWKKNESHLLGKIWASGFFIWIHVLLLGNALPLIDLGKIFPSRGFSRLVRMKPDWTPEATEAVVMSGIYGFFTLILMFVLGAIITPAPESQLRGWRRARKYGKKRLPWAGDSSTAFWSLLFMAIAGAACWFIFTRALVESRWFPGHVVPIGVFGYFTAVLFAAGVGAQLLMEWKGGRAVFLTAILLGVVPMMAGSVLAVIGGTMTPLAIWIMGLSPASLPFYAPGSLLSLSELPREAARALPRAFYFWMFVSCITALWLAVKARASRKEMAARMLEE